MMKIKELASGFTIVSETEKDPIGPCPWYKHRWQAEQHLFKERILNNSKYAQMGLTGDSLTKKGLARVLDNLMVDYRLVPNQVGEALNGQEAACTTGWVPLMTHEEVRQKVEEQRRDAEYLSKLLHDERVAHTKTREELISKEGVAQSSVRANRILNERLYEAERKLSAEKDSVAKSAITIDRLQGIINSQRDAVMHAHDGRPMFENISKDLLEIHQMIRKVNNKLEQVQVVAYKRGLR